MRFKNKCRELNQAKSSFITWLKKNKATGIDIFIGPDEHHEWDYYRDVTAFINDKLYNATFMMWNNKVEISYKDDDATYENLDISSFLELIK